MAMKFDLTPSLRVSVRETNTKQQTLRNLYKKKRNNNNETNWNKNWLDPRAREDNGGHGGGGLVSNNFSLADSHCYYYYFYYY